MIPSILRAWHSFWLRHNEHKGDEFFKIYAHYARKADKHRRLLAATK